ncbi:MAG: TonB-dependent receptor [Vicinamibacterales bacterium]
MNLLTTNLFDAPQQLLSGAGPVRGIAYIKLGAPVGQHADWTVRGALNDGDLSSWVIAGAYQTRGPARRTRDIRLSYSTQRYEGGHPLALREVTDGSRNAGSLYAFETFSVSPSLSVAYGARYERFDYLDERNLVSPRAEITLRPLAHTRVSMALSSRADAPGAQEFLPPSDEGIWLPPQRTFSSARPGTPLRPERANQVSASLEREWGPMTVALRAFRQDVDDQMATVFGTDVPEFPGTRLGHYVLGTAGDVDARGGAVAVRADLGSRFRGSIAYSQAVARMTPITDVSYLLLLAPSTVRARQERLHDVTATVQAEVPETSTRVLILYRVGIGYARPGVVDDPGVDSRFDVQVRQSLPFLNFTSARWEMLIAIRNSFRDVTGDQSIYDELLTVQAPKRLIGGVSLLF